MVADEVRKLAERTGQSTGQISTIIHTVGQQATTAVGAMDEVDTDVKADAANIAKLETAFIDIIEAVRQVSSLSEDIAHSTREQKLVAEQTAVGMEVISRAVEQTTATIAQMASAAEQSAQTADAQREVVSRFRTA